MSSVLRAARSQISPMTIDSALRRSMENDVMDTSGVCLHPAIGGSAKPVTLQVEPMRGLYKMLWGGMD